MFPPVSPASWLCLQAPPRPVSAPEISLFFPWRGPQTALPTESFENLCSDESLIKKLRRKCTTLSMVAHSQHREPSRRARLPERRLAPRPRPAPAAQTHRLLAPRRSGTPGPQARPIRTDARRRAPRTRPGGPRSPPPVARPAPRGVPGRTGSLGVFIIRKNVPRTSAQTPHPGAHPHPTRRAPPRPATPSPCPSGGRVVPSA